MKKNKKANVQEEVRFDSFVSQAAEQGPDMKKKHLEKSERRKTRANLSPRLVLFLTFLI